MIFENVVAMDALEWSFQLWGFANRIGWYVYYEEKFKFPIVVCLTEYKWSL